LKKSHINQNALVIISASLMDPIIFMTVNQIK